MRIAYHITCSLPRLGWAAGKPRVKVYCVLVAQLHPNASLRIYLVGVAGT